MKQFTTIALVVAGVALLGVGAFVTYHFANQASAHEVSTTVSCSQHGVARQVVVRNGSMVPVRTTAKLCDTLTITNADDQIRLIAFGAHEHHTPYDGVTETTLEKNQHLTVVLNQAGTFAFHDHLDDNAKGTFTVSK